MSTQCSSDLIWRVVKGNNAFLKKQRFGRGRDNIKLSAEPRNVLSLSTFKYSGVAHTGCDIALAEDNKVLVTRGKTSETMSAGKMGAAARMARKGRKDLRTAFKAKSQRLRRLVTRKTRKSWAKTNEQ